MNLRSHKKILAMPFQVGFSTKFLNAFQTKIVYLIFILVADPGVLEVRVLDTWSDSCRLLGNLLDGDAFILIFLHMKVHLR